MMNAPLVIALVAAPFSGGASVIGAVFSAELGEALGSGLWGAAVNQCIGLFFFYLASFLTPPSQGTSIRSWLEALRTKPFEGIAFVLAGLCSAYYVIAAVLLPPHIGYGVFFVSAVCVEIFFSNILEFTGFLWTEKHPIKVQIIVGSFTVLIGTIMFEAETLANDSSISASTAWMIILACVAGFGVVLQTALNRRFSTVVGGNFRALGFGQTISACVQLCGALISSSSPPETVNGSDWWKFFGGMCSFYTLSSLVILPSYIGYAATFCCFILGQLTTSLIIDSVGAFGNESIPTTAVRIVGFLIVVFGVLLVQLTQTKFENVFPNLLRRATCRPPIPPKMKSLSPDIVAKGSGLVDSKEHSLRDSNSSSTSSSRSEFSDVELV